MGCRLLDGVERHAEDALWREAKLRRAEGGLEFGDVDAVHFGGDRDNDGELDHGHFLHDNALGEG